MQTTAEALLEPARRQAVAWSDRFLKALLISAILHDVIIFAVGADFLRPNPKLFENSSPPLEVVLVNARHARQPIKPDVLAQANLDGGGDVEEDRQARSPLLASDQDSPASTEAEQSAVRQAPEADHPSVLTRERSNYAVPVSREPTVQDSRPPTPTPAPQDLAARSLEMLRLQARIDEQLDAYQKRPRRENAAIRAREYSFARYVEDWRIKVERIGNLNYPEEAKRQHLYGTLILTVAINADGSLEDVSVDKSSGFPLLDAAAKRIVRLSAPYPPFPADMRQKADILEITRTWSFTREDQLTSR